jgi:nucleoid DNA-binding protein
MTKSERIAKLAARYPQLVTKDAEVVVKAILEAMITSLVKGGRIEIRGFGSFGINHRPTAHRQESEDRSEGASAGKVRAALQGWQRTARAG